jgi:IS605 OrfB family transposase
VYYILREDFPTIPSQGIIKIYKECISAFRSINSNGHIEHKIPAKKNLSMRLDKRLYSKMSIDGISLCSEKSNRRAVAEIVKFPRLIELFKKFPTQDPLIFMRDGKFYLSIPFDVPEIPVQNDNCIGVDLGERRFAITSDGILFNDKEYNARRRKLRYLKRCLQKKGTKSARRHKGKLSIKEMNQSTDMCYKVANAIIDSTTDSFIIIEDLSNIKKNTSKSKEGFKKKNHNRRIGQVPFYKFKQILSYKALLNGKRVETVSPFMTSQTDCTTGKKDGTRKNRRFYCKNGTVLDADWNGAVNIARKSKHPFSFKIPLDGTLRTWKAGCKSTTQSYISLPAETMGAVQAHAL